MFRLACVPLLLLLTYQLVAQAKVSLGIVTREEDPSGSRRTLYNIVWGCVSTTIICAWAAIHPNIPPREGPFKGALRRLELMFWTIVAPEILPCWAMNQRLAAMTVRDVYNNAKGYQAEKLGIWKTVRGWFSLYEITEPASPVWTVAHGHFLIMGGFHVVEPPEVGSAPDAETGHGPSATVPKSEGRVTILTLELLRRLLDGPELQFNIQITKEEIMQRSKGDALSKIIFMLQSTWFILQCIVRVAQRLKLTQFELTTLALASLNGITFGLWWDKPLGAQTIVRVDLKRKLENSERLGQDDNQSENQSARSDVTFLIVHWFKFCVATFRDTYHGQLAALIRLPLAIFLLLALPIVVFCFAFFATLFDLLVKSTSFRADDKRVPTFYVPEHDYPKWYHFLLLITLGITFGGIHCPGWGFSFPTHTEQMIWRVTSLMVTIIPSVAFPFGFFIYFLVNRLPEAFEPFAAIPGMSILFICALAYVVARLMLIGLALSHLRHLPPSAYATIDWTKLYPHIL